MTSIDFEKFTEPLIRDYLGALDYMKTEIDFHCCNDCDNCFQRTLCEAVEATKSYIEGRMKDAENG